MAELLHVLAAGVVDADGDPLASGTVYVYRVGTTTKLTIYSDVALATVASNPVTLNAAGQAEIYVNEDARLVIQDSSGTQIWDIESCGEVESLRGDVDLGTDQDDTVSINGKVGTDVDPAVAGTYKLGDTTNTWKEIYLDDATGTHSGAIYFNGGTTAYLKGNAAATVLQMGGFTSLEGVSGGKNFIHAWINFNGTGTPAITDSFNVASITDNGTGDYTINLTTAFADANYCVLGISAAEIFDPTATSKTTTAFRFVTRDNAGSATDSSLNYAAAVGAR